MSVIIGGIADDFGGATDLANTWVREGMRVCQVIGVPDGQTDIGNAEAVVVALQTRVMPVDYAVGQALAAQKWLRDAGARQIVFKYCSTFASTSNGNIGPVSDALMEALGADFALISPAFPEKGRTVYKGQLYVGDELLADSPMKDHPLTPMRDANLMRLMGNQSRHEVGLIPLQSVRAGAYEIRNRIADFKAEGIRYAVVDALTDNDLRLIGLAASGHALVTGGSGIGMGLPDNFRNSGVLPRARRPATPAVDGRDLVVAGSYSEATRQQIEAVSRRWPTRKLKIDRLAGGGDEVENMLAWAHSQPARSPVLIFASDDPAEVAQAQDRYGAAEAGQMVKSALGGITAALAESGFSRIVVAGGQTSGAVVSALGVRSLRVGPEIERGVPWTEACGERPLALALKTGEIGDEDFFSHAFDLLS